MQYDFYLYANRDTSQVIITNLLLHNGNPLEDISILRDPQNNLALIMKGGEAVKLQ